MEINSRDISGDDSRNFLCLDTYSNVCPLLPLFLCLCGMYRQILGCHNCQARCLHILVSVTALPSPSTTSPRSSSTTLAAVRRMSSSGHRQATWALTLSSSSASSLRWGALSDYRQHDLTECEWSHTCCAARSLARFGFGDNSRENGWSIGALVTSECLWL